MASSKKIFRLVGWMGLFFHFSQLIIAQEIDSLNHKPYKNNLLPTPSFTYSPQTDVVVGLYALYQFKLDREDFATRPSNAFLYYGSSVFKQNFFTHGHTILTHSEKFFINGLIEYKIFPEQYYGIGPDTEERNGVIAQYNSLEIKERVLKQFKPSLFIGLQGRYVNTFNISFQTVKGDTIKPPEIPGSTGGDYLGLGIGVMYDKRNSILTPIKNSYLELSTYFYGTALGVDEKFMTLDLDTRKYIGIKPEGKGILAVQALFRISFGEVPFRELALLGGNKIMRGYLKGRFRDLNAIQIQSEYRFNIIGRFGMTGFFAMGNVMPKLNQFDLEKLKATLGGGFRFNVNRKDTANVRLDFGWSLVDSSKGIYITFGEAF